MAETLGCQFLMQRIPRATCLLDSYCSQRLRCGRPRQEVAEARHVAGSSSHSADLEHDQDQFEGRSGSSHVTRRGSNWSMTETQREASEKAIDTSSLLIHPEAGWLRRFATGMFLASLIAALGCG